MLILTQIFSASVFALPGSVVIVEDETGQIKKIRTTSPNANLCEDLLEKAAKIAKRAALIQKLHSESKIDKPLENPAHPIAKEIAAQYQDPTLTEEFTKNRPVNFAFSNTPPNEKENSGDFWKLFETSKGNGHFIIEIVLGDAPSHGVKTLPVVTYIHEVMNSPDFLINLHKDPKEVLKALERPRLDPSHPAYLSAIPVSYMRFDTETGEVNYVYAGADPAVRTNPVTGNPYVLGGGAGGLLMLDEYEGELFTQAQNEFHSERTFLKPGETVVMYTDGIAEANVRGTKMSFARDMGVDTSHIDGSHQVPFFKDPNDQMVRELKGKTNAKEILDVYKKNLSSKDDATIIVFGLESPEQKQARETKARLDRLNTITTKVDGAPSPVLPLAPSH